MIFNTDFFIKLSLNLIDFINKKFIPSNKSGIGIGKLEKFLKNKLKKDGWK